MEKQEKVVTIKSSSSDSRTSKSAESDSDSEIATESEDSTVDDIKSEVDPKIFKKTTFHFKMPERPEIWDPKNMLRPDDCISIIGQRRTGKTTILFSIMKHIRNYFHSGVVFTGTASNGTWQKIIPDTAVFNLNEMNIYLPEIIARGNKINTYLQRGELMGGYKHMEMVMKGQIPREYSAYRFVILDDWVDDIKVTHFTPLLNKLFIAGRHACVFVVSLSQYCKGIGPKLRNNVDWMGILAESNGELLTMMVRENMSFTGTTTQEMIRYIQQYTQDHHALIINKAPLTKTLNDTVFVWRGNPKDQEVKEDEEGNRHVGWRLGCNKFWEPQEQPDKEKATIEKLKSDFTFRKKAESYELHNHLIKLCI